MLFFRQQQIRHTSYPRNAVRDVWWWFFRLATSEKSIHFCELELRFSTRQFSRGIFLDLSKREAWLTLVIQTDGTNA